MAETPPIIRLVSPDLGQISYISDFKRPKNAAKVLNNFHYIAGKWTTRDTGWSKHRDDDFQSGAQFLAFGIHTLSDGSQQSIFQVGDVVFEYDLSADPGTEVETSIYTASSATERPCMRSHSPAFFLYTNKVDVPKKWSGSAWANLAGFPVTAPSGIVFTKAKFVEVFQNRAAFAGLYDNAGTPVFRANKIIISQFGNPEGWTFTPATATTAIEVDIPTYLGKITGMRAFKLSNENNSEILVVGCERGVCAVIGTSPLTTSSDPYRTVVLTSNFGIASNNTYVQLNNDLYFLATDGIRSFSSTISNANLQQGAISFPIHDVIRDMNTAQAEQAFAVHNPNTLDVVFWYCSSSDTQNTHAVVLNYSQSPPGSNVVAMFSTKETPQDDPDLGPACGILFKNQVYCGGYNGILQDHYSGNQYDDRGIPFDYVSAMITSDVPNEVIEPKSFHILTEGADQEFDALGYVHEMKARTGETRRKQVYQKRFSTSTGGGTALGAWVLGEGAFPSEGYQLHEFTPRHSGIAWEIQIRGLTDQAVIELVGVSGILESRGINT